MQIELTEDQLDTLIDDVQRQYGYDFGDYARASLHRRIARLMTVDRFVSFAELRYRINSDKDYLSRLIDMVSVNVTEMFRDPSFYAALRTQIFPVLATYPLIRIWHAGCASGEEVYSMAILLKESKLLDKSIIYATDINPTALSVARAGIYPLAQMQKYSENYVAAGGTEDFSRYYTAQYDMVKMDTALTKRIVYATHNLATDSSFNEFQLIICRNVLIYFNQTLQDRVFHLFDDSLEGLGFIGLGSKESIRFSTVAASYQQITGKDKIWRKGKK